MQDGGGRGVGKRVDKQVGHVGGGSGALGVGKREGGGGGLLGG